MSEFRLTQISDTHLTRRLAPSAGFIISGARQELIGIKEVGLVEYRFQSDSFEVRHVKAPGQIDVDLDELLKDQGVSAHG
jgi:hypothetical protein